MKRLMLLALALILMVACTPSPRISEPGTEDAPEAMQAPYTAPIAKGTQTVRLGMPVSDDSWYRAEVWQGILAMRDKINLLLEDRNIALRLEYVAVTFSDLDVVTKGVDSTLHDAEATEPFDIYVAPLEVLKHELAPTGKAVDITNELILMLDLYQLNSPAAWKEASVDGRFYGFPLIDKNLYGVGDPRYTIRYDDSLLAGAEPPESLEALITLLREAKARGEDHKLFVNPAMTSYAFHRTYPQWPFYVDENSLFVYYQDGTVEPYITSDIFLQDVQHLKALDDEGLILWADGQTSFFTGGAAATLYPATVKGDLGGTFTSLPLAGPLAPERAFFRVDPAAHYAAYITSDCQDIPLALEMLQTIYCNPEIGAMLAYGDKGIDWDDDWYGNRGDMRGLYAHQAIAPAKYRISDEQAVDIVAVDFPVSGFQFHSTSEPIDYAANFRSLYDLRQGLLPLSERETVLEDMNAHGLQQLLNECRVQYEAYLE